MSGGDPGLDAFDRRIQIVLAASGGDLRGVKAALAAGPVADGLAKKLLHLAAEYGHPAIVALLRDHGVGIRVLRAKMPQYSSAVQVAAFVHGRLGRISVENCARQGVCPEALYVLLERQGRADLVGMLKSLQLLDPLTPDARADLLRELLAKPSQSESLHV